MVLHCLFSALRVKQLCWAIKTKAFIPYRLYAARNIPVTYFAQ